jgi:predicted transcriptional regulator
MKQGLSTKEIEKRAYLLIKKSVQQKRKLKEIEYKRRKGELMMQILAILAMGVSIPLIAFIAPNSPIAINYIQKIIKKFKTDKRGFIKSIQALKKQNLIKIKRRGDKEVIEITEKGKRKILSYSIRLN